MTLASASPLLAAAAGGAPLLFRQLFDAPTGTFTYLLADVATGEGVLIDPVFEQHSRDLSLIQELGIRLVACLDTQSIRVTTTPAAWSPRWRRRRPSMPASAVRR
ncbi:MAG: hypothetical protein ACKOZT_11605, partial [Cyanobium sp.]